ncbi:hypothetical protein LMJF_04_1140 [Leishmania major strain Friedlin]|uniref:Uncharacterized protein n=1 Tax=Leishmania major TaxID=5664 RepID=O97195_LEIMA|nr:hypothetical protein LMJF_04_1140 [Leishmania major strain Friedlin]CAC22658.1 hypothetical protein LMJF_04_1140 [Leishmania major strain Friedlin]CAG9567843.1 hypothetical_protein_-_conserved [Leishmania major strain Friedlin]|eukprot:XP_888625.1 hypothetical protein LMJF_04_1140 [Leishmania major strain Friedlin]
MSSTPDAPRPVIAKRHHPPQYLAPGQHLKVASRKPAQKLGNAAGGDAFTGGPPRDPWEDFDENREEPCPSSAGHSGSQRHQHTTTGGGHPYSGRVSVSRSTERTSPHSKEGSVSGLAVPPKAAPPTDSQTAAGDEGIDRGAAVSSDEDDHYYTITSEPPKLSAAERAKQVLEAQHRALEAKQLKALTQQGVARRPATLVRNRHGRLNAIAAQPVSMAAEESGSALLIAAAPASASVQPEKSHVRSSKAPEARTVPSAPRGGEGGSDGAVDSPRDSHDDLVDSCPSTTIQATTGSLEIDLD